MSQYIETATLKANVVAPEASDDAVFTAYAEGASRLFDLLCDVAPEFFAATTGSNSVKTFYGDGVEILRLPPLFQNDPSVIASITVDGTALLAADYIVRNEHLIRTDGLMFDENAVIVCEAQWGFETVPSDVQTVVQELAIYLWRNKDPYFAKISDVEIEKTFSPTTNAVIKKYRDKYGFSAN